VQDSLDAPPDPQHALLDAVFTHAPVGLVFWDLGLRYRRINAAMAAINGLEPGAHLGRTPSEVLGSSARRWRGSSATCSSATAR